MPVAPLIAPAPVAMDTLPPASSAKSAAALFGISDATIAEVANRRPVAVKLQGIKVFSRATWPSLFMVIGAEERVPPRRVECHTRSRSRRTEWRRDGRSVVETLPSG